MPDNKMTPDEAYNLLVAQVHAPVFFTKLANVYNVKPQSPEEAREMLLMAGQLRNAHEQQEQKQASARPQFLSEARRNLNNALATQGFQPLAEEDQSVKQAASQAVQNPLIKEAALVFNNYMAQALQQARV